MPTTPRRHDSRRPRAGMLCLLLALLLFPGGLRGQRLSPDEVTDAVREALPASFELYRTLLSYPNDAHHRQEMLALVEWLEGAFEARGFTTERLPTAGLPLMLAERSVPGADRTVLIYLQSDGQPVDPSAWNQDSPYGPVLKERAGERWRQIPWSRLETALAQEGDGPVGTAVDPDWRIFARSASDSKGPIAQFLSALDVAEARGIRPDFDMKVIVDTEEELGSPNLPAAVERFRDRLAADMLAIFDGPPHISGRPTLKFGARGIATFTLTTHGPRVPQHSGHYGNYAPNPALRLSQILASMKDEHGRVTIPGWYRGIEIDPEVRRILADVPDDEAEIQRRLGIATIDSVAGTLQGAVQYPSLNVRGLRAGWVGDEARTIIPATATAEVDVRLVKETDPERLLRLVREHIEGLGYHLIDGPPTEAERQRYPRLATFTSEISYGAFRTAFDSEPGRWLTRAFEHLYGGEPVRIRTSGGSVPISPFVQTLGVPAVSVPTVNPDNNQHSPNENLRVANFIEGIRTFVAVLQEPVTP